MQLIYWNEQSSRALSSFPVSRSSLMVKAKTLCALLSQRKRPPTLQRVSGGSVNPCERLPFHLPRYLGSLWLSCDAPMSHHYSRKINEITLLWRLLHLYTRGTKKWIVLLHFWIIIRAHTTRANIKKVLSVIAIICSELTVQGSLTCVQPANSILASRFWLSLLFYRWGHKCVIW